MSGPYSAKDLRVGTCAWENAEVPDTTKPLTFSSPTETISLIFVSGADDCTRVDDHGWFRLPTAQGKIVDAPVLITIGVCPRVCEKIGSDWSFAFSDEPCRR